MKSQSLLPTKIDGRDIVKTIKQSDPLDLAIWKLMADGKKRTREDVATALREYGFRRDEVDDRMVTLFCSSNRRWFDSQGRNKNTTYQLRKNRLERPFARGGIDFESISNIRDILVIDEEAKRMFEEQENKPIKETVMTDINKPKAPAMPDDDTPVTTDHSQMGAHNWFGGVKPSVGAFPQGKGRDHVLDPLLASVTPGAVDRVADALDASGFDSSKLRAVRYEPGQSDNTPEEYLDLDAHLRPLFIKLVELLKDRTVVKTDWFDKVRAALIADPTRPMSVISDAMTELKITANESFETLRFLGELNREIMDKTYVSSLDTETADLIKNLPASEIGPGAIAKRVQETGFALSDLDSQNFAAPLALQKAEEEGRLGEHIADQIFTDGPGAKFQVIRTYRKDDLETTILRIFAQTERVFAIRDLGDLLVGHPTPAIDYRVRKFLAAGLLKRIESGEGSDRRVHYHFNGDGRYTRPGQEVLDRTNGIAKEDAEHINSINVELDKYAAIPGEVEETPVKETQSLTAESFVLGFDPDRFIRSLPRSRMDSGLHWFGKLVSIYGRDVSKIEVAMQALVDAEQLTCSQLTQARDEFKRWAREENKEEVVDTKPNRARGEAELSSGAAILKAEGGAMSEEVIQTLLTSGEDRSVGLSEHCRPLSDDAGALEQLIQNAKRSTEALVSRNLHEALEAVFADSDLVKRYFDNLVNSKDTAVRNNTLVELITKLDPMTPTLDSVKLANAASMAYQYFEPKDVGLDFALAATGTDGSTFKPTASFRDWANLESSPEVDQVSIPYNTKPLIVVRGMVLTADEAREIKNFVEGISSLSDSAAVPAVLKSARIEIQDRAYTFEEIEEIGIELLAIFN